MTTLYNETFETGIGTWQDLTNCTIAQSATVGGSDGTNALRIRSVAGGDMSAYSTQSPAIGGAGVMIAVTGSAQYTYRLDIRAGASIRTIRATIDWYQGTTFLANATADLADAVGSWTLHSVTANAHASADRARLRVQVFSTGAANEDHYIDAVAFNTGADTSYPSGGGGSAFPIRPYVITQAVQRATLC